MCQRICPAQIPNNNLIITLLLIGLFIGNRRLLRLINPNQGIPINLKILKARITLNDLVIASRIALSTF